MRAIGLILVTGWLLTPLWVLAGTYQVTLTTAQEATLDREIADSGLTRTEAIQRGVNRLIREAEQKHQAENAQIISNKFIVATGPAKQNANNALNAGITAPTITDIPNQTHNVAQVVAVPIVVSNPYPNDFSLTYEATGLPPGIAMSSHPITGAPQLMGTLTTAGTFNVTVTAHNDGFSDIKGTDTFTWTVNP
jgi:hypothetical protein